MALVLAKAINRFSNFKLSGPSGRASSLSSTSYDESSVNLRRPSISQCSQSRIENYSPCIKRKDITKLQSGRVGVAMQEIVHA